MRESEWRSPNTLRSHTTVAITTMAFKMDLIVPSMGMKRLTNQSRTPTTTRTINICSKGMIFYLFLFAGRHSAGTRAIHGFSMLNSKLLAPVEVGRDPRSSAHSGGSYRNCLRDSPHCFTGRNVRRTNGGYLFSCAHIGMLAHWQRHGTISVIHL
jgi:hypothetical protein